jgi:uncharacterized phage protein gp47/JayE
MATQPSNIPVLPAPVDFTAADFDTCLETLQLAVNSAFPQWTDFNRAAIGNVMLRSFCFVLDILTKYQNDQASECFFPFVKRRRNMLSLARGVGVKLKGISAASVDIQFALAASSTSDVIIPADTLVTTIGEEPQVFRTTASLRIAAGQTQGTVPATATTDIAEFLTSDGTANQRVLLQQTPFVEGSTAVLTGSDPWIEVDNFFLSGPTDRHYVAMVNEFNQASLIFGNGVNGQIPPIGDIEVAYEVGGGFLTNVQANTITLLSGAFTNVVGSPVTVTATNPAAASGGADRETVEQARRRIPGQLRALVRTVALEDFEINALGVVGVSRAMFLTKAQDATVADNAGVIIVIPDGGGLPSTLLKNLVVATITVTFPTMVTFAVTAADPSFNTIDITCDVKAKTGFTNSQIEANINAALASYFALLDDNGAPNDRVDFGANLIDNLIPFSDLLSVVAGAAGVQRVDEDTFLPADNVAIALREFPQLGTVTVNFI